VVEADETPYIRPGGYPEHYRDQRFAAGSGRRTHSRETRAICHLLDLAAELGPKAAGPWLDAPSGAGRMSTLLPGPVVQVDRDLAMLTASAGAGPRVCASVQRLPFRDRAFAGVLCMRLLHHIPTAEERRRILAELRRVSRGPVLLSFFHSVSLQHARRCLARRLYKARSGRSAVRWQDFAEDLRVAGLEVVATRPLARFISEQWLVLARPVRAGRDDTGCSG
jgi:hypothetical protein